MKIKPEILIALAKLAPRNGVRYALNGIYFDRQHAVASDGHLYLSCALENSHPPFIAPIELFKGLKKATKNKPNIVDIQFDNEGRITLHQDGIRTTMQAVEANYPKLNPNEDADVAVAHYDLKLTAKLHTVLSIIEKKTHYVIPKGDRCAGVVKGSNFTAFIMPLNKNKP